MYDHKVHRETSEQHDLFDRSDHSEFQDEHEIHDKQLLTSDPTQQLHE